MENRFYYLDATFVSKWYWGGVDLEPWVPFFVKGMVGFKGAVKVEIESGFKPPDILWNSHSLLIVTDKVLDVWKDFDVRYETYDVLIEGKVSPVKYTGIAVLGRGGPFDPVRSGARYGTDVHEDGTRSLMGMKALYFDESQWDGSDLFMLSDNSGWYIVTERLVEAMKTAGLTNCNYRLTETVNF